MEKTIVIKISKKLHNFPKKPPILARFMHTPTVLLVIAKNSVKIIAKSNSEKFSQNNIKNPDFDSVNQVPGFFMLFAVVLGKSSVSRMN